MISTLFTDIEGSTRMLDRLGGRFCLAAQFWGASEAWNERAQLTIDDALTLALPTVATR